MQWKELMRRTRDTLGHPVTSAAFHEKWQALEDELLALPRDERLEILARCNLEMEAGSEHGHLSMLVSTMLDGDEE